jgi:hypothetical protein
MSKRSQKPVKAAASVPTGYGPLLAELKSRVRAAQVRAALSVNRELIALYWDIGRVILQRQQAEGWGAKVVARSLTGVGESVRSSASRPVIQLPGGKLSQPATESPTGTGAIVQQVVGEFSQI